MTEPDLAAHVVPASGAGQDRASAYRNAAGVSVLVVADGAGGTSGGAAAAQSVIEGVIRTADSGANLLDPMVWKEVLWDIGVKLKQEMIGQTTAVVVASDGTKAAGASVGDSVAWIVRDDDYIDLTEEQPRKPLLGGAWVDPLPILWDLSMGEAILLASDGLSKYALPEMVCCVVREALTSQDACDSLIRLVRLPNGRLQDDVGIAVARSL